MRAPNLTHLLSCLLLACGGVEPEDTTGTASSDTGDTADMSEPHATLTGKVDVIGLCGTEGATVVTFLARRVGCESLSAPCTIKIDPYAEWSGDAVTCPSSQTALDMRVEVPMSGRYQIEALTMTPSGFQSLCYGQNADVPTVVTAAQIDTRAEIFVEQTAKPCPDPA
jgi:hypothetical protein